MVTADPRAAIALALERALTQLGAGDAEVRLERPRDPEHGDWATNVALTLARRLGKPPRQIAEQIAAAVELGGSGISAVEVAGPGFLNFRLAAGSITDQLARIIAEDETHGLSASGAGERIVVEWVSANPTGPLHLGHGRQAALGDVICNLLAATSWSVHREFYYNDAGTQMDMLARSVRARYLQVLDASGDVPEGGYQGEYVLELAREFQIKVGDRYRADEGEGALDAFRRLRGAPAARRAGPRPGRVQGPFSPLLAGVVAVRGRARGRHHPGSARNRPRLRGGRRGLAEDDRIRR